MPTSPATAEFDFGGLRMREGIPHFAPRLPPALTRLSFRIRVRGSLLVVAVTGAKASYAASGGEPARIGHYGEVLTLAPGQGGPWPSHRWRPPPGPPSRPAGRLPGTPPGREHPGSGLTMWDGRRLGGRAPAAARQV